MKRHSSHQLWHRLPKLDCLESILVELSLIQNSVDVVPQTGRLLENDFRYCFVHSVSSFTLDGAVGTSLAAIDQWSAWWPELPMLQLSPNAI